MQQEASASGSLSRTSLVKQVLQDFGLSPIIVSQDTPVIALPASMAENRICRTIAVVDQRAVLVGIIPVATIMQELLSQAMPEELLVDVLEPEKAAAIAKERHARTAGELMHSPLSLSGDDTVQEAVHKLHQAGLEGLPVIDEGHRVTGYFDLFQVMLAWWQRQHPSPAGS